MSGTVTGLRGKDVIRIPIYLATRGYTFTAYLRKKTGSLIIIRAGCRVWQNFAQAFAHYDQRKKPFLGASRWSDEWIMEQPDIKAQLVARMTSVRTLEKLQRKVKDRQLHIRRNRNA